MIKLLGLIAKGKKPFKQGGTKLSPKHTMCLLTMFLLVASTFILMNTDDSYDATFENSDEFNSAISTNIPVIILSNNATNISQSLSFGTNAIFIDSDMPTISDQKAIFIDQTWAETKNEKLVNKYIKDALDAGIVLTTIGSADLFLNNPNIEFLAFMEDCDTYSIYKSNDNSKFICYSVDDGGSGNAIEKTYCWINTQINNEKTLQKSRILDLPWGTEYSSSASVYHSGYGYMNIETNYFVLNEDNTRYNYYYTHFFQESVPDSSRYTADMYTKTQNLQSNLSYLYHAPTTTPGNSTVSIGFGTETGLPDLIGVSVNVSWSYSVPDVVVNDRSNTGTGLIDIWHDVNEDENVGQYTYYIEPAKLMKVDCQNAMGHCIQRDEYSIQFCKKVLFWKEFSTVDKTMYVVFTGLPHVLTIDSNGADGWIYEEEDPDYFEDVYTHTYSEGSYVTLYDFDYYKTGYTFIGYSSNPNSTVAEYPVGSSIQLLNDTTLYMVWV